MFRNFILPTTIKSLQCFGQNTQQIRNTFILKRKWPPGLHRKGQNPKKMKARHFVYDLVEFTDVKPKDNISVILTQYVAGLGEKGDVVEVKPRFAYNELLLPGFAVYSSAENVMKYSNLDGQHSEERKYSSPSVERTIVSLSKILLKITMNKTHPWIIEPWHIKTSFRKIGFIVPEYAIEMPPGEIQGPDVSLEDKDFFVTVTINKKDKVNVRCRIFHYESGPELNPLWGPDEHSMWLKEREALFPEQAEILRSMQNVQ